MNRLAARWDGTQYPYGTFFINVLGALIVGITFEMLAFKTSLQQRARLFVTTGIIGGFTTFSTYALETALLYERGELLHARCTPPDP